MIPFYETPKEDVNAFYADNIHFPVHLHNSIELIYVEKGSMYISVNQQKMAVHQGDFVIVFPNTTHEYHEAVDEGCLLILSICRPNMTGDFWSRMSRYHPVNPVIPSHLLHPNVVYSIKELAAEQLGEDEFGTGKALIQLILSRIFPLLTLQENDTADNYDITYRVIDYVLNHYQEPITLTSLSKALCVSKYHLSRIFSSKLHLGFKEYLNSFRLDCATSMLRSTNQPITVLALEAGFESQRTFNRVFKNVYGVSPKEYRFSNNNRQA